ncbi:GAK9 protein, partial [Eolophus roseicapillus]|nr:GAK9 protein [Eolophus roseicapilla]
MERQAACELFIAFLQKRQIKGIDLQKELQGLLAYGQAKGCFVNPHTVHELAEWRKLGDKIWEAILDDDKTARKLGKLWRVVHNELLQYQVEKRAAEQATTAQGKNRSYETDWSPSIPMPSAFSQIMLPSPPTECGLGTNSSAPEPTAPPAETASWPEAPANNSLSRNERSIPGAESDLAEAIAKERREAWAAVAKDCLEKGDEGVAASLACPVTFQPQRGLLATVTPLDWKLLSQLRATASQFGVTSEPVKQMLDYIWTAHILLPSDCRSIAKLIFSQHQQLLFGAHWQNLVNEYLAIQRQPGDPLYGVTMEELMGRGAFFRTEAQALLGPDKCRAAMNLARRAIDQVKEPGGIPSYMGIKQGRDESFGSFIDKAASALDRAGVPEYMRGALLKQCALENCNAATRNVISTLGANWSIEEALERMASQPTGPQAVIVDAIKQLAVGIQEQAKASQTQVLAALAPLQASAMPGQRTRERMRCYRCGRMGHLRRECTATGVWCQKCRSDTHNITICRRGLGNSNKSASSSGRAPTQIAAAVQTASPACSLQPAEASAWTWQPQ